MFKSLFRYLLSQNFILRIKELNLTCMINDSERITEKLGHWFLLYHSMAFQNNKISDQFLNELFQNLSQFPIWQPMAEIGWTAECGKKLPDKKCRKKLYFPSSIILEKTGLDSENHVRSSSCWRPSFIMQLKLLATIRRTIVFTAFYIQNRQLCLQNSFWT